MAFIDSSPEAHTVTEHGDAQVITSDFVLGNGSGLFGPGDYISIADDSYWDIFRSNWSIEFRMKLPSLSLTMYTIFEQTVSATTFMRCSYDRENHKIIFNIQLNGVNKVLMSASATLTANTWYSIELNASAFILEEV